MIQLVFSIDQMLEKSALMPVKEWTCQREQEQSGKRQIFLFLCPLYNRPSEVQPDENIWNKVDSSHLRRSEFKENIPTSNELIIRNNPSQVYIASWVLIKFSCSKINYQD